MSLLLSPQTLGKTPCGLSLLILMVFVPTQIITNCVYHPKDLGVVRSIRGPLDTEITFMHIRNKRNLFNYKSPTHNVKCEEKRTYRLGWVSDKRTRQQDIFTCPSNEGCTVWNITTNFTFCLLSPGVMVVKPKQLEVTNCHAKLKTLLPLVIKY